MLSKELSDFYRCGKQVLILVLMEYALEAYVVIQWPDIQEVLILVLMEYALEVSNS